MNEILCSLFSAWILTWFNFDKMVIEVASDLLGRPISTAYYYVGFVLIGFIIALVRR